MSIKYVAKQLGAALVAAVTIALVTTPGHAFTSKQVVTETASATVAGGAAQMTVAILNVSNNAAATSIAWPSINAGQSWTEASQYLQIASTLTVVGAGIQTYTNNTVGTANPKYTGTISSSTSAGLVNTTTTNQVIPLAWSISTGTPVAVDDPNCTGSVSEPSTCVVKPDTGYAWFYYADKAGGLMPNADAGDTYIQPENYGNPPQIQFAQGTFGNSTSNTNNLYLEANFQNALGGSSYQTSTLTVELYTN